MTNVAERDGAAPGAGGPRVIGASALGTLFEWYDFFLYGALAGTFATHLFAGVNETTAFLLALAAAASGAYAALLAELFPARIRYTAVSFPQNLGNGWFGGLLPAMTFAIVAATGDVFAGLWYLVGLATLCLVVGLAAIPETRERPAG